MNATTSMPAELLAHAVAAKGFMPADEGDFLYRLALAEAPRGPILEVGTYCGKSGVYLGAAAQAAGGTVFTVDHHRGSEENQAGWEHHDTEVVDPEFNRMDTLPFFRKTILRAGLENEVIAIVGASTTVARWWTMPLAMLFIDGGHGEEPARADYEGWVRHVKPGGLLVIHDVFPDPADGGRPPYEQIYLPALASGEFIEEAYVGSMRALRRVT